MTRGDISLAPSMSEVVRYVNESYIVTCLESERKPVKWAKHKEGSEKTIGERGHPHVLNMTKGIALVFEKITSEDRGSYSCSSGGEGRGFRLIVICKCGRLFPLVLYFNQSIRHRNGACCNFYSFTVRAVRSL